MASGFDIHDAARRGNIATITTYIRAGGDLYAQDKEGNPPLHVASRCGREASVAAFLGAGVDPAALNSEGRTPLYYAQQNGHEGCAALLRGEAPPTRRSKSCSPSGQQQRQQQQAGDGGDRDKDHDKRKKNKNRDKEKDKGKDKDKRSKTSSKSNKIKTSAFFDEDDGLAAAAAAAAAAASPSMLSPPPPPTAPSAAAQQAAENSCLVATPPKPQQDVEGGGGEGSDWHLCHDEAGNAYYYSETTGESVWAEVGEGETGADNTAQEETPAPNPSTAAEQHHIQHQHQPPEGWSFHHDPETGHGYYLHEASATSVWAGVDGSFPGVNGDTAAEGVEAVQASGGERGIVFDGDGADGIVAGDACTDWDTGILMAAAVGERPAPTAPPPFSSTLEMAGLQAGPPEAGPGADGGRKEGEEEEEEDTSMLLCTQGIMSTNNFFAAQQLEIYPPCSGGSPMASAPPAAESGGRRSSVSPLPTSGAGDDNKMWPASPAAAGAVAAEDVGESVPGNTEGNDDQGRGTHGVQESSTSIYGDEKDDGTESSRGERQPRSFAYPAAPLSPEAGIPPTRTQDGQEAGERARHFPEGPPPAVVRVAVWDTAATVTPSNSNNPSVSTSQSNHFSVNLSGYDGSTAVYSAAAQSQWQPRRETSGGSTHGDDEVVLGSDDPATPSKYEILLEENPETPGLPTCTSGAETIGVGSAPLGSFYPKLVDRSGVSGGYPDCGGGGNRRQEDGTGGNMGKPSNRAPGAPREDEVDGSLAQATQRSLSMEDNGLHRMAGGGGK